MAVFNLFSKRKKLASGKNNDILTYNKLPEKLRVQVVQIIQDALCQQHIHNGNYGQVYNAFKNICSIIRKELGVFVLPPNLHVDYDSYDEELFNFILRHQNTDEVLDAIELSFRVVDKITRSYNYAGNSDADELATEAISELNTRFKESSIGYSFEEGDIIKVDSTFIHAEVTKSAIILLSSNDFSNANKEFLSAHEHYRHGKNAESLNDCLKSFESTMKIICAKRRWVYKNGDSAKALIAICFTNGLIPTFWQSQFTSLSNLLESSIPTGRNKLSGHGSGTTPPEIPDYLVSYMLHMTASTIVFLVSAEKALP